jgi:hypothetical protein
MACLLGGRVHDDFRPHSQKVAMCAERKAVWLSLHFLRQRNNGGRLGFHPKRPAQQSENRSQMAEFANPIHILGRKAIRGGQRLQEKFVIIFIALFLYCDKK